MDGIVSALGADLGGSLLDLLKAIAILIVGWIVAYILRGIIQGLLNRTEIDNKIASWLTGGGEEGESPPIEDWIGQIVYWLVILFAVIAALEALQLRQVSEPLQLLLNQVTGFLPQLGAAAALLGLAWILATLVKMLVLRGLRAVRFDERLGQQVGETEAESRPFALSETIGNALYWFIFLIFLPSILSTLELEGTLEPVQDLLNQVLAVLPNIFAAVLVGAVGWLIAQIVRRVVTNLLAATGIDRVGARFGIAGTSQSQSLSWIFGTIVYVLVLIPVTIAALNRLQIEAISEPAIAMLEDVAGYLPLAFGAAVIMILGYVAGQYLSELVASILTGVGFNNVTQWLGLPSPPPPASTPMDADQETASPPAPSPRTPSEIVGLIVFAAILLFATLAAVDILKIPALTALVAGILAIAGQVLAGLIIFAIGLYFANLAFSLISSSGNRQANILGQTARIAVIALAAAMALQQMGIAPNIINLAFGLLLGAIAVAIALAFGLGSRDIAAAQVREWLESFKRD